ncbi:cystatin domain-containing protein [Geobacter sp. AOG1]|uniref:cystatin domain-containing protein n=1 Tax=Geobacter sp. AOG1 TaxID=1566346 RepID=UPI001CC3E98B|nr:cystatin domain-containing protein [Geobacter sp. AOG1]GFE56217.1 hypothetical protein AOG1_00950 [Geobacter sp. AOG1]
MAPLREDFPSGGKAGKNDHFYSEHGSSQKDREVRRTLIAACVLFATSGLLGCLAQHPMVGGYTALAVTNKEVTDAAVFAVKIQQKVMQRPEGEPPAKLELTAIVEAEQQVVAGMNYRLRLKVKVDGVEKDAEAVVWWQPWRKPEPYQLTSWNWQ